MGPMLKGPSAKGCLRPLEGECWIDREISGCEFRDARLGDRFRGRALRPRLRTWPLPG